MYASVVEAVRQSGRGRPALVTAAKHRASIQLQNPRAMAAICDRIAAVISLIGISLSRGIEILLSRLFEGPTYFIAIRSRTFHGVRQRICPRAAFVLRFGITDRHSLFERQPASRVLCPRKGSDARNLRCRPAGLLCIGITADNWPESA